MRRLDRRQRAQILAAHVEGNSMRAICRLTGIHRKTVTKFMLDAGLACSEEHHKRVINLTPSRIEVDEIWSFVAMKSKRVPEYMRDTGQLGLGSSWTFTSIDPDTKLIPSYFIGGRDTESACIFLKDLERRIPGRFQLSTDGAPFYNEAVLEVFGLGVDYGQVQKTVGRNSWLEDLQYKPIMGNPNPSHISTSIIERHNLTMRMSMRRFTRRTNGYSKRVFNLYCALSVYVMYYNFVRPHSTLTKLANGKPTTPAMAANLAQRPWTLDDIIRLVEAREDSAIDIGHRVYSKAA